MPLEYLWAWSPCQGAVGVPAALRWQTAAGGIGNPIEHCARTRLEYRQRRGGRQPQEALAPDWALGQDAVGVPAALRWQTAAGGIGSRKGKGPTKWEGPPAAVCHLSAPKQSQQTSSNKQPQQTSCNKAAATTTQEADPNGPAPFPFAKARKSYLTTLTPLGALIMDFTEPSACLTCFT